MITTPSPISALSSTTAVLSISLANEYLPLNELYMFSEIHVFISDANQ